MFKNLILSEQPRFPGSADGPLSPKAVRSRGFRSICLSQAQSKNNMTMLNSSKYRNIQIFLLAVCWTWANHALHSWLLFVMCMTPWRAASYLEGCNLEHLLCVFPRWQGTSKSLLKGFVKCTQWPLCKVHSYSCLALMCRQSPVNCPTDHKTQVTNECSHAWLTFTYTL